jgi:hypothetical protein
MELRDDKGGKMKTGRIVYYRALFLFTSIYDVSLGIVFMLFYKAAFQVLGVSESLPRFGGYVSLIGAFLFVIGVAYFLIFRGDLAKNRDLILVGALYKLAYCAVAFVYFAIGEVPHLAFVFVFGVADFVMLALIAECYIYIAWSGRSAKSKERRQNA